MTPCESESRCSLNRQKLSLAKDGNTPTHVEPVVAAVALSSGDCVVTPSRSDSRESRRDVSESWDVVDLV